MPDFRYGHGNKRFVAGRRGQWPCLSVLVCLVLVITIAGCSETSAPPKAEGAGNELFCKRLAEIREARHPVSPAQNELIGHAEHIARLYEAAPEAISTDLLSIHQILSASRDAKGTDTLLTFQTLTDPELAGHEGRVAQFAREVCGISDGDTTYFVDHVGQRQNACPGWPLTGSPLTNDRFPYLLDTSSANYFSNIFFSGPKFKMRDGMIFVPHGGKVTFRGEYPFAGYFGFHPNDMATNNLQTLMDVDIVPDAGSHNPWRGPAQKGKGRNYTAHLVFDEQPEQPEINTSYVGKTKSGKKNYATFQIYRVYGADLPSLPPNSAGVLLPSITVQDKKGRVLEHHPKCNPYPEGFDPPSDNTRFPAFPVPDHRAQADAGKFNLKGNFGLGVDLLSNGDVLYISSFYGRAHGEVFAIRAKKPKTIHAEGGRFAWSDDLDFRMWTACTYNFWNGKANDCLVDHEVLTDEDGFYTLLVTEAKNRPRNASDENGITWMDAGNFFDGQISFRMLPKNAPFCCG